MPTISIDWMINSIRPFVRVIRHEEIDGNLFAICEDELGDRFLNLVKWYGEIVF